MAEFRFKITLRSDDIVAIHALRGVAYYSEGSSLKMKAVGGATEKSWSVSNHSVTFQFTSPRFRARFVEEAERLLSGRWSSVREHDEPA